MGVLLVQFQGVLSPPGGEVLSLVMKIIRGVLQVEYDDGLLDKLFANMIAEEIFAQVNDESQDFILLNEIIDHQWDSDVVLDQIYRFDVKSNGTQISKRTTKGWKHKVCWKVGGED